MASSRPLTIKHFLIVAVFRRIDIFVVLLVGLCEVLGLVSLAQICDFLPRNLEEIGEVQVS